MTARRCGVVALALILFSFSMLAQYSTPVRDVENPARTPFFAYKSVELTAGGLGGSFGIPVDGVPAGKRVVLEFVAVQCQTAPADSVTEVRLQVHALTNTWVGVPLQVSKQGDAGFSQRWAGGTATKLYVLEGSAPISFGFARSNNVAAAFCAVYVSGHTLNP